MEVVSRLESEVTFAVFSDNTSRIKGALQLNALFIVYFSTFPPKFRLDFIKSKNGSIMLKSLAHLMFCKFWDMIFGMF